MILIGELSLWVALLMAIWGATVSFAGGSLGRRDLIASGERAIYATLAMVVLASLGLWTAIFTHDFSFKYVASFTSANLPTAYLFASFWAGPTGSLLFWSLILSIYSAIAVRTNRTRNRVLMPYVSGTLAIVLVFLIARMCLGANPYERLDWIPPDGRGMNPELQNPGMVIHPPMLYLGYLGATLPFAFAIAALVTRRIDADWLTAVRKWALLAWFFTTAGILLGMWWAYVEPDRGGYWALDPVENASLLPWLVNTAFLYAIMIQEKRGLLRRWNVTLIVTTFLLATLATLITRSGIISSVHSFAGSSIGNWFAAFLVLVIAATFYVVTSRLKDLEVTGKLESPMTSSPQAFVLLARNRRRYGGYIVKAGVVLLLVAFAGLTFRKETDLTFRSGDSRDLVDPYGHKWTFVSQGISRYDVLNRQVIAIVLDLSRDRQPARVMSSEKRQYFDSRGEPTFDPSTEAGIKRSPGEDIYVVLETVRPDDLAEVRVTFNPLAVWVWIGGLLVTLGGVIVMWPRTRDRGADARNPATLEPQPVVKKTSELVET